MVRAIGSYVIDLQARTVATREGTRMHLSKRQFDILALMVKRDGQAVSHDDFAEVFPGIPDDLVQSVRDVAMKLRRRLPGLGLHTVPAFGYRVDRPEQVA